jgi:hypothetical protein
MQGCLNLPLGSIRRHAGPRRRLKRRVIGLVAALALGATMIVGETWLLRDAPKDAIESAASEGLVRVLDQELGIN